MNLFRQIALLICYAVGLPILCNAQISTVKVSATEIRIPTPDGLFRLDGKNAKIDEFMAEMTKNSDRVLARFGSKGDLADVIAGTHPKLAHHFDVVAVKKMEEMHISTERFAAIKAGLRQNLDQNLRTGFGKATKDASAAISKELETKVEIKLGEPKILGVFEETPESICFSILTKVHSESEVDGATPERLVICASSLVNVGGKVVQLNCISPYQTDTAGAHDALKTWRDAILDANSPGIKLPSLIQKGAELKNP